MKPSISSESISPKLKKLGPFDFITSINEGSRGVNLMTDDVTEKGYVAFIVNRGLSYFPDAVLLANEMNWRASSPVKWQYDLLKNAVRPRKRFSKWFKREDDENLELIMKTYNYSSEKAREALTLLSQDDIQSIKKLTSHGGRK